MAKNSWGDNTVKRARNTAIKLLAIRPRTVVEMRHSLGRKFGADVAEQIVDELLSRHLLDDAEFAMTWCQNRERSRPRSAFLMRQELLQKGVDWTLAERAVLGIDDAEVAERIARNSIGRYISMVPDEVAKRLFTLLKRRGFSFGIAQNTIRLVIGETFQGIENTSVVENECEIELPFDPFGEQLDAERLETG